MSSFPAAGYLTNSVRTEGEVKTAFDDWLASTKQLPGGTAISTLTIATGSVTPTGPVHRIDTEAAAATDDLTNVNTANLPEGSLVLFTNANAGRVVVVKHNAGGAGLLNLKTAGDFTLADPDKHWLLAMRIGANWTEILRVPEPTVGVVTRTSNTILGAADLGKVIDATSGTWTQTFEACATLGKGWWVAFKNSGTGIITLDPNASETIDVTIVNPGDELLIVCDGTNLKTYGRYQANDTKSTVASAASPDIWTGTGNVIDYTGTTTATGFANAPQAGARRTLICAAACAFTAGANLLIQGVSSGNTYTAAAGDIIHVVAITTTQFRVTILKADGTPMVSGGLSFKLLRITRDLTAASGAVNTAHGGSGIPKLAHILAVRESGDGRSEGYSDGTNHYCIRHREQASGNNVKTTVAVWLESNTAADTDYQTATVSFDATNLTLTWTKTGSPTGSGELIVALYF